VEEEADAALTNLFAASARPASLGVLVIRRSSFCVSICTFALVKQVNRVADAALSNLLAASATAASLGVHW
jgi:hypothetical protein